MQVMTDINHGRTGYGQYQTTIGIGGSGGYVQQYKYDRHYITISQVLVQIDSLVLSDFSNWTGVVNVDYPDPAL